MTSNTRSKEKRTRCCPNRM